MFVKMDDVRVAAELTDGAARNTCPAAIGLSMLAGAEDGRGVGKEGLACNATTPDWLEPLCSALTTPCQAEKPIALEMGAMKPYPWTPEVLPVQIVRIGSLAIVAVPYELSTMAGRRLRETVASELRPAGVERVVISGLANAYAGYVVTREEYAIQHYEGASTHFGPWTLAALQQEFRRVAVSLREGTSVEPGPVPRDLSDAQRTLIEEPAFDTTPEGRQFGDVVIDAEQSYRRGQTVRVAFWSGNPNHDLMTGGSYLVVERQEKEGQWQRIALDRDWETKFLWERHYCLPSMQCSQATVEWQIPEDTQAGTYRIRHEGRWKSQDDGSTQPYSAQSRVFEVQ
jgi:neutral ceramidase